MTRTRSGRSRAGRARRDLPVRRLQAGHQRPRLHAGRREQDDVAPGGRGVALDLPRERVVPRDVADDLPAAARLARDDLARGQERPAAPLMRYAMPARIVAWAPEIWTSPGSSATSLERQRLQVRERPPVARALPAGGGRGEHLGVARLERRGAVGEQLLDLLVAVVDVPRPGVDRVEQLLLLSLLRRLLGPSPSPPPHPPTAAAARSGSSPASVRRCMRAAVLPKPVRHRTLRGMECRARRQLPDRRPTAGPTRRRRRTGRRAGGRRGRRTRRAAGRARACDPCRASSGRSRGRP